MKSKLMMAVAGLAVLVALAGCPSKPVLKSSGAAAGTAVPGGAGPDQNGAGANANGAGDQTGGAGAGTGK